MMRLTSALAGRDEQTMGYSSIGAYVPAENINVTFDWYLQREIFKSAVVMGGWI
jgi:hypothetical protein